MGHGATPLLGRANPGVNQLTDARTYLLKIAHRAIPAWMRPIYDADDAVQETLLEAWRTNHYDKGWLITVVRHKTGNALRRAVAIKRRPTWRSRFSREPSPAMLAALNDSLSRLCGRWQRVLLGDEAATHNQWRMIRLRAERALA